MVRASVDGTTPLPLYGTADEAEHQPSPLPSEEHLAVSYWDPNATNDPGHRWFRDVLVRAAAAVDTDSPASDLLLR